MRAYASARGKGPSYARGGWSRGFDGESPAKHVANTTDACANAQDTFELNSIVRGQSREEISANSVPTRCQLGATGTELG